MVTSSSNNMFIYGLMSTFICYAVIPENFKLILMTSGLPLHFVIEPQSAFLSQRSGVTLDCGTEPESADIHWYFNGSLMTTTKQEVKGIGRSRLNLTLNRELGFYHCVASNSNGAVRSLPAFVNSAYLSDFGEGLFDRTIEIIENNTAVIPCATPAGQPSTITEFEFNSTWLLPTDRHLVLPSGNLQISKVRMEDSGIYRCTAVNPLTGERRHAPTTVMLKVITEFTGFVQPRFTWTPRSHLEVIQGENLTLECAAEGWPVPQLSWKRYGGVLPKDRSTTIWGNLMIKHVEKSDEGTYICQADVNATHSQDYVAFIDVLEPPMVMLSSSSDHNVTQFDTVTLLCHVTGSPEISVRWYHNALPVVTSQEIVVSSNGSLTLHNVQLRDSGMYQCFAENSVGVAYASARLTVGVRESEVDVNSLLHDEMQDGDTNNDRVTPGMRASGARKLKKLQKNLSGQSFSMSSPDVTESEFSSMAKVEDEVNSPATLLPPSKPTALMASNTSILLNWTVIQNGSLPVMFFKVQYKEIVDSKKSRWKTLDEEIPPLSRSYEVLALKSGAVYQFRIAAVYSNHDHKIGPTSERMVLETDLSSAGRSRVPVSSPMIVDVRENITSFIVFWQYKPSERVTVDGFKIFYKPYADDVDYQSIVVMGPNVRNATIANLKPYTIYSIQMSCFNSDGESISGLSVARKTLGLPGSSEVPSNEKEILDLIDSEQTTTVAFAYYATNRNNTHASNELLFIVLGVVLGVMILGLCVVMVMCACKQRQQRRLFAALDGHRRFHDPSRAIYIGSQTKSPVEGNFLLNGVGVAPKKPAANGYLSVFGNGVAPGDNRPSSEHQLGGGAKAERNREDIPLRVGQDLPGYDKHRVTKTSHVLPLTDDRQMGHDPTSLSEPSGHDATGYHPPKDLPTMSRPHDVPFHSLKSSRVPCDHRLHGNDGGEPCPPFQAAASPDHIPRLHECQLLYRSPEHTRRSRDRTQGPQREQVSNRSLSASSQLSGDLLRPKPPDAEIEPYVVGCSKINNILPVELHSSDDAVGHPEDGGDVISGLDIGLDLGCSTEDSVIPVGGRISQDSRLSQSQSDSRRNSDCLETVELSALAHSDNSDPREDS